MKTHRKGTLLIFQPRSLAMQPARCPKVLPAAALTLALELPHKVVLGIVFLRNYNESWSK